MSQDVAAQKKRAEGAVTALLQSFRTLLETVEPREVFFDRGELLGTYDRVVDGYDREYDRVARLDAVLFGKEISTYGAQAAAIFQAWEKDGGGPFLPAIVGYAIDRMDLDAAQPIVKAALFSAVLAEYPNGLQYHGNEHYRKVLFHAIRLMATHNHIHAGTGNVLNSIRAATLLTAACIHDLGHQGGDNAREGVYTPGFMEQRAIDIARAYFDALGVGRDEIGEIETMVFCTDITFFAGDNSPCVRMKKIYKHFFWDDQNEDVSMMMMGKLRRFEDNPKLVLMAMMLHEADVATSAGLSYEQTVKETINIMEERGLKVAGPRTVLAFLREQLGETMFTESSRQIFGVVMGEVIRRAEADIERGRKTFYEP